MSTVANVQSRIAGLAEGETTISGVAIGAGDVTRGLEGTPKAWEAEHLRAGAPSLEGVEINALHSQQTVGRVTRAGFDPEQGVLYEATLEDAKLAENIARGGYEVSIEARHADGGTIDTDAGEAMLATDIEFTGMAIVQHGAAPSASADPGEAAALSASAISDRLDETADLGTHSEVAGVRFSGTQSGQLDESELDADEHDLGDHYLYGSGEDKEDFSYPVVDADGDLRRGNVDAAHELGCRGQCPSDDTHDENLQALAEQFENPPEWAAEAESADAEGDAAASANTTDDPTGARSSGRAEATTDAADAAEGTMTDDDTNDTDLQEQVTELKAELSDRADRISDLESEIEQYENEREEVAREYASALAEDDTLLDEDALVEKFSVSELSEMYEEHDAASLADAEPDVQSGGTETADAAAGGLDDEQEAVLAEYDADSVDEATDILEKRYERFADMGWDSHKEDAADQLSTLGVEV